MAETSLPVEHLFAITIPVDVAGLLPGGPQGTRVVVNASSGTFEGPKLKGTTKGPGGDWVTARADGSLSLDVRLLLETDDGALILMTYKGISPDGGTTIRSAPYFETGDKRYAWLNNLQAVATGGTGTGPAGTVTYDVYQLL
jgi:hypothetical protein